VARTTQGRREAAMLRRGRFARGSSGQAQSPRRFPRGAGQPEPVRRFGRASARPGSGALRGRRGQPEQSGAQKLVEVVRGALPGGREKSSAKSGKRSSGLGGLLSSLGGKEQGGRRGRKSAMFGLLGAGAAGAAAVAKRRQGRRSSQAPGESRDISEAHAPSTAATTPAHGPDKPKPGETGHGADTPAGDETSSRPDTPAPGDEHG
jgi:hypothetical protein